MIVPGRRHVFDHDLVLLTPREAMDGEGGNYDTAMASKAHVIPKHVMLPCTYVHSSIYLATTLFTFGSETLRVTGLPLPFQSLRFLYINLNANDDAQPIFTPF